MKHIQSATCNVYTIEDKVYRVIFFPLFGEGYYEIWELTANDEMKLLGIKTSFNPNTDLHD
jgi:hypothetical protein